MKNVVGVKFKRPGKIYFLTQEFKGIQESICYSSNISRRRIWTSCGIPKESFKSR